jgi:hypothetical protein
VLNITIIWGERAAGGEGGCRKRTSMVNTGIIIAKKKGKKRRKFEGNLWRRKIEGGGDSYPVHICIIQFVIIQLQHPTIGSYVIYKQQSWRNKNTKGIPKSMNNRRKSLKFLYCRKKEDIL